MKIELIQTCGACPEQYDARYNGRTVGYLRLRHGFFSVECPYVGGEEVYCAEPDGDGLFEYYERSKYLKKAKKAIRKWLCAEVENND